MKTSLTHKQDVVRNWYEIDASNFVVGRLSTRVATLLIGKHKVSYTPHVDGGDFVVVINAAAPLVSGRKQDQKVYTRFTGYPGGIRRTSFRKALDEKPEFIIRHAVELMLPKNKLRKLMLRRLHIVRDAKHNFPINVKVTK